MGLVPYFKVSFPGGSEVKAPACNAGDLGLIPGSGRSPGEGNGNPLQYSCLENPMDRGAWWAIVHRVTKSRTRLSDFTFTLFRNYFGTSYYFASSNSSLTSYFSHSPCWLTSNPPNVLVCAKLLQCPTLCDPMLCKPPGSPICEIPQARILEWVGHALLQEIFPTQGLNPHLLRLLHWHLPLVPPERSSSHHFLL